MPLETQVVELLFEGLDQKFDGKVLPAGKLTRAENVEFDKRGVLNKRRGFRRYQFTGSQQIGALGISMDTQAVRLATYKDELLIFGIGWLWAVVSKTASVDGKAAVRRGRLAPGNIRVWHIATAAEGTET